MNKLVDVFFKQEVSTHYSVKIMGVLNLSPESFYKHSIVQSLESVKSRISHFINEGAEILDFGPKSTAPLNIYGNPNYISIKEEIKRLKIPLKAVSELNTDILISIDTQSAEVANYGLENGAHIINDISGFKDPKMARIIATYDAGSVIMSTKEKPGDMFLIEDIKKSLLMSISHAEDQGVDINKIILDPGIGGWVSTRLPENDFEIIRRLSEIRVKPLPILVSISRKSFIGAVLSLPPEERLYGSISATAVAVVNGANIIRTHDVRATRDAIRIAEKLRIQR
ncbi:MAG: Dihydropteroate synthase [Candidatus Heimdallarchaeota archaeon LC_3]|nr:MAG: Dihydropteroate synthase [Candidatus Heimdallarchaeota archaeon LC_3]